MKPIQVSRRAAARFVLAKQGLLEADGLRLWRDELTGVEGVLAAVRRLECVQIDPVSLVERNHHLVLRNRVGGYQQDQLDALLSSGRVFEHWANARCFLPMEDYPVFRWQMRRLAEEQQSRRGKLGDIPDRIVAEIRESGPRSSREIESDEKVVGYWDSAPRTKATSLALELLWEAGDLMIARRNGIEKVYDVPERLVPSELRSEALEMSEDGACRTLLDKYYRAYRLLDTEDFRFGWRKMPAAERRDVVARQVAAGELVPVEVEGVRRQYCALAADVPLLRHLGDPEVEVVPNVFILPPLDNVLWRRERLADLFGFDYTWEIYIPQAKRRFGAYAVPVLRGDRFAGRVNLRHDREAGALVVEGVWLDDGARLSADIEKALFDLAAFVGAGEVRL
ncbi:MAG: crosslink repair DNA glycosylase YcaQ family protein [Bacillota bacterium]